MKILKIFKLSPLVRITLGLVALTLCIVLVGDSLMGVSNRDELKALQDHRKKLCETLAVQFSTLAGVGEMNAIGTAMTVLVDRNDDVLSIALRDNGAQVVAEAGNHGEHWVPPPAGRSTLQHAQVPIFRGADQWGTVEVSFAPVNPISASTVPFSPLVKFLLFITATGFAAYLFFMKRTLKHLDPTAVIPDRVRQALDLLAEGVVLIDERGQMVLANAVFSEKLGVEDGALIGKSLSKLGWCHPISGKPVDEYPWDKAMQDGEVAKDVGLMFPGKDGEKRQFTVNSSPIVDANMNLRGVIATFNDETALQKANEVLMDMMEELRKQEREVKRQNEKLKLLATLDSLTGCLNRRSFFERVEEQFTPGTKTEFSCIMADVDHFKNINDRYGHSVGDQVIQQVAEKLGGVLGNNDLLCRYGGEEFCIILPGKDFDEAAKVADRARGAIEELQGSIGPASDMKVTASLGVSSSRFGAEGAQVLVDQADKALYAAKQSGRNQVVRWDEMAKAA